MLQPMNEQDAQAAAVAVYLDQHPDVIPKGGEVAIFRAVAAAYLDDFASDALHCRQSLKPAADALARRGLDPAAAITPPVSLAIVFATKHREEVLYHIAEAVDLLVEGGSLIIVAANDLGAASLEKRCAEVMGSVIPFSKHKCRVLRATREGARIDAVRLADWRRAGELQLVPQTGLFSRPGLFSWKAIDAGSRLLAAHLPADLAGSGADLGAGYGYLSRESLRQSPGITELHLFEAEQKALAAAERNLAPFAEGRSLHFHWADVTAGLPLKRLDFILMNPPFHAGRGALPALGSAFVRQAMMALRPGGRLFLVANRHLPYEGEIEAMAGRIEQAEQDNGYKVIVARKIT